MRRFGLLLVFFAFHAEGQTWRELGPAPITDVQNAGRAAALAVHPTRASRVFVGAASGGVWRTRDAGRSWQPLTDGLPTTAIGALALDPANVDILYAGSGEANYAYHSLYGLGLFKSTDGGDSWRVLARGTFAGRTFSRLVISTDDGSIWAAVARAGGTFRGFEGARGHPRAEDESGIFRSTDGGETWRHIGSGLPAGPSSDIDLDPVDNRRVYASFGDVFGAATNGIYLSENGGARFRRITPDLDGRLIGRISLAIAPSDPDRLYALLTTPTSTASLGGFSPPGDMVFGVYRSDDGGDNWTLLQPGNFQRQQGSYNSTILVHPEDPDTFFVGGVQMLRSRDGGLTYEEVTPPHVDLHDLAFDAAGRLLVATDGGIFRSSDLGDRWIARNAGLGTVQLYAGLSVHPTDAAFLIAGTQDNGTNLRLGADGEWIRVFGGDGGYTALHPDRPERVFVEFQGAGNVYRSSDGGRTFQHSSIGIDTRDRTCFLPPILIDPTDPDRMLYATQRIYESTNGGGSWQAISGDLTGGGSAAVRALVIAPSDPQTVYATTNDGRLLVSVNGGRGWDLRREGLAGWPRVMRQVAVDPEDAAVAFVADSRFGGLRVLRTDDRGQTWSSLRAGLPNLPVNTVAVHRDGARRWVLAGTDAGIYLSEDGNGWQPYGSGLPNAPVQDIVVDVTHNRVVISTLGRGIWTTSLPSSGTPPPPPPPPPGGCAAPPGSSRYCDECGPCSAGEGDCDGNAECRPGLVCASNVGAEFGFRPNVDVCVGDAPVACSLPRGHGHFCRDCGPCPAGEGDCDSDAQCLPGLVCASNVGAEFGFRPNVDVCR